jgi:hypothetical protein
MSPPFSAFASTASHSEHRYDLLVDDAVIRMVLPFCWGEITGVPGQVAFAWCDPPNGCVDRKQCSRSLRAVLDPELTNCWTYNGH